VLGLIAHRIPEAEIRPLLESLSFSAGDREVIAAAIQAPQVAERLVAARRPSQIAAAAESQPPEVLAIAGALGPADPARAWLRELQNVRLQITGEDLLAAGLEPGPAIGRGLRAALAAKLDGRVAGRAEELAEAEQAARSNG
jgi:tRNA nucleotidyltransferase (CCA-adding enzyme)